MFYIAPLILSLISLSINMPIKVASILEPFQNFCHWMSPQHSDYVELYRATVCGVEPNQSKTLLIFRNTGLYHLIVVSGAHLIFLSIILSKILFFLTSNWQKKFIFILLFIYSLMAGLNPPLARALLSMSLVFILLFYRLDWPSLKIIYWSGFIGLIINPEGWGSLSYLLSWSAALGLALPGSPLKKCLWVYLLLLAPLSAFCLQSPLTILTNYFLAPILGLIMLPLSFLPFILPIFLPLTDTVWLYFIRGLEILHPWFETTSLSFGLSRPISWAILLFIHITAQEYLVYLKRKSLFSNE